MCVLLVVRTMVGEYSILGGSTKPHIIALVQDIWMEDLKVFKGRVGVQEHRWIDPLVHCL